MSKYIVVVGGVISGTGKGISAASIGLLLNLRGHKVSPIKLDPYLNVNAGVLAPREHGEVFLCEDGSETDLDLGHYERIINMEVSGRNILTSGTVYKEILKEEEEGKYLGQTVQIIPHVTNKIQERLEDLGKDSEIVIAEIGGTVGDLESGCFLEAVRQFKQRNWNDVLIVLVAPILWIPTIKEFKTKPLQQAVKELQGFGLQPEILLCRIDKEIPTKILDKVSNLTNVPREAVFTAPDVSTIYQVPIEFYNRHIDDLIADKFHLKRNGCRIHKYRDLVEKYVGGEDLPDVEIAIVGKYENCDEAYLSLKEALYHAGVAWDARVNIRWLSAETLEQSKDMRGVWKFFEGVDGVIVPGGFDSRGVEGKIRAIKYVREKKIPFLGICLGLQCAVIEVARNLCGLADANSTEFSNTTQNPVIHFVEGQEGLRKKSGTMRLGAYDCELIKDSIVANLYKKKLISERHRHRYEVNPDYIDTLKKVGLLVSGKNPDSNLVEMIEISKENHPYFVATQAHPEFKSRLGSPAPLFAGLIQAALEKKGIVTQKTSDEETT
jgi:CTP synthase